MHWSHTEQHAAGASPTGEVFGCLRRGAGPAIGAHRAVNQ